METRNAILGVLASKYRSLQNFKETLSYCGSHNTGFASLAQQAQKYASISEWLDVQINANILDLLVFLRKEVCVPEELLCKFLMPAINSYNAEKNNINVSDTTVSHFTVIATDFLPASKSERQKTVSLSAQNVEVNAKIRAVLPFLLSESQTLYNLWEMDNDLATFINLLIDYAERTYPRMSVQPRQNIKECIEEEVRYLMQDFKSFPHLFQMLGQKWETVAQKALTPEDLRRWSGRPFEPAKAREILNQATANIAANPEARLKYLSCIKINDISCSALLREIPDKLYPDAPVAASWSLPDEKTTVDWLSENINNTTFKSTLLELGTVLDTIDFGVFEKIMDECKLSIVERIVATNNWKKK